jgi:iron-sulfur cluster assembly accessory protein
MLNKNLRLVFQPPKSRRMDDAVTVALEGAAKGAHAFRVQTAPGGFGQAGIGREHRQTLGCRRLVGDGGKTYIRHASKRPETMQLPPFVTDRAFARLAEIAEMTGETRPLRVAVEGGGCSGFHYDIKLDEKAEGDLVLEQAGQTVLIDPVSLPFLAGAKIDFSEELIGARFVIENPNASSSCGCGTSFSI